MVTIKGKQVLLIDGAAIWHKECPSLSTQERTKNGVKKGRHIALPDEQNIITELKKKEDGKNGKKKGKKERKTEDVREKGGKFRVFSRPNPGHVLK